MSGSAERLGTQRLHWMIAWRHLRVGDTAPTFVVPLLGLSAYLIVIGLGLALVASYGGTEAAQAAGEVAPLVPELTAGASQAVPIESYYALIGGGTLFVGVMLLLGAVLSRIFTLLATVIIISVMLGCMALVVVLSLMTGLEHELRDKILGQLSHIQIAREDHRPFSDYDELVKQIAEVPGIDGVSPYLKGEVMVRNGLNRQGGILTGILPAREATVSYLPTIITEGRYEYLDEPERIPEPSFSFEMARDDNVTKTRTSKNKSKNKSKKKKRTEAEKLGKFGLQKGLPKPLDSSLRPLFEVPAEDADDGWEDPALEIPKLRADGSLPPSSPSEVADVPEPESDKAPLLPVAPLLVPRMIESHGKLARPGSDADEGWEDPEEEIPKLRQAGVLPPETDPPAGSDSEATPDPTPAPATQPPPKSEKKPEKSVLAPVLIGSEKARELIAHLGDRVQLITPIGRQTPVGRMPGRMDVRVAGVFHANHYEYDRWLIYAPLGVVQSFLRTGDRITGIEIRVDDLDRVGERKRSLQELIKRLGRDEIIVRDWHELNASLFSAMALEKIAVFIALLCVILVASFGILGSNLMSVLEKSKEIAILKTMGTSDTLIQRIFIAEGLCLGILGSLIGIGTGIALCLVLDRFGLPLSGNLGDFETLPVAIDPLEVLLVGASALVIVWLSSLYPARVASRMRPVQALRKAEA